MSALLRAPLRAGALFRALASSPAAVSPRARAPLVAAAAAAPARGFRASAAASQAKAKAKPGAAAAGPAVVEKYDLATQIPVNLLKEGDEPTYQPDAAYPPWLWTLLDEPPLLEDLAMKGVERLTQPELKRVIRLASKKKIKTRNDATSKITEDES
jgi:hypothetical protein